MDLILVLSWNRRLPSRIMVFFAFHTLKAIMEATDKFKHLRLAFCRTFSVQTLSESLVLVMVWAVALMALLISSVAPIKAMSSLFSLIGGVTEHPAKILTIRRLFVKVAKRCGGIAYLAL